MLLTTTTGTRADPLYSPRYSVTDLGTSFSLQEDSDGHAHSVTNAGGTTAYVFDKSPVTMLNHVVPGGNHAESYRVDLLSNNGYTLRYNYDDHGSLMQGTFAPSFSAILGSWITHAGRVPVADMNSRGEVVGMSEAGPTIGTGYAAYHPFVDQFIDPHLEASEISNLNNYIPSLPGDYLISASKIDDQGRILASGSTHRYLLTPLELGPPATVPEPSTLAFFGVATAILWLRRKS